MRNITHRWPQSGHIFQKFEHFFPIFEKGQGRPPRSPPCSYTPRYNELKIEKFPDYLTRFGLILWYTGLRLWKTLGLPYWIWINFINNCARINSLTKQRRQLQKHEDFLELPVQIHRLVICALLYLHPHYCAFYAALWLISHIIVTYINSTSGMFPHFFSEINYIKKNSPNTVKSNLDIMWCKKKKVNVVE